MASAVVELTGFAGQKTRVSADGFLGKCRSVEEFEKLNRVGEGTYGIVYRARDLKNQQIVALKRIRLEPQLNHSQEATAEKQQEPLPAEGLPLAHYREILLLQSLRHPNIVEVQSIAVGRHLSSIFTVMEYCQHDLAVLIDGMKNPFTPSEVKCLMHQLLKGLEYLHRNFIIHRDLKLSNLLLASDGTLKIADFGLARKFSYPPGGRPAPLTPCVVTLWYRAPEVLYGEMKYTTAIDMWSAGCIFGELLLHQPLLPGKTEIQQLKLIAQLIGSPNMKIWPGMTEMPMLASYKLAMEADGYHDKNQLMVKFPTATKSTIDLLNRLLTYDPDRRCTVDQSLKHDYFSEPPQMKDKRLLPTFPDNRGEQYKQMQRAAEVSASIKAVKDVKQLKDQVRSMSSSSVEKPKSTSSAVPASKSSSALPLYTYLKKRQTTADAAKDASGSAATKKLKPTE